MKRLLLCVVLILPALGFAAAPASAAVTAPPTAHAQPAAHSSVVLRDAGWSRIAVLRGICTNDPVHPSAPALLRLLVQPSVAGTRSVVKIITQHDSGPEVHYSVITHRVVVNLWQGFRWEHGVGVFYEQDMITYLRPFIQPRVIWAPDYPGCMAQSNPAA